MIPYDEIDSRLRSLGKNRAWLAEVTKRSPDSVRTALAPKAPAAKRSTLLQMALSEAIEREEASSINSVPVPLGHRLFVEPSDAQFHLWMTAAYSKPGRSFDQWAKAGLDELANEELAKRAAYLLPAPQAVQFPEPSRRPGKITPLPFYGAVAAGTPAGALDDKLDEIEQVPGAWPQDGTHYVLRVNGRSMEPEYPDESLVVCRKLRDGEYAKKGQHVIASDSAGAYFKCLEYRKEGKKGTSPRKATPALVSINPDFPDVVPVADCPIVAVVVGKF